MTDLVNHQGSINAASSHSIYATTPGGDAVAVNLREAAYTDLQAAIRRHQPELQDPLGYSLVELAEGLLYGIALIGPYADLLGPLQRALDAVGWLDPHVRGSAHTPAGHQRYVPLGIVATGGLPGEADLDGVAIKPRG